MACEHKKTSILSAQDYVTLSCTDCGEVLRQHKTEHVEFARKFYANAPDDAWIIKNCPMELKFMEQVEAHSTTLIRSQPSQG